jgi:uncharacterized protein (DUF305 family)
VRGRLVRPRYRLKDAMLKKTSLAVICSLFATSALAESSSTTEYKAAMEHMHHNMDICYTGNADTDFTAGMVPHHQGAVEMAQTELRYGKNEDMRDLAAYIIYVQKREIAFMTYWHSVRGYAYNDGNTPSTAAYKQAMDSMHAAMMQAGYTGDADIDFARNMIPHHQGAVDMAAILLRTGRDRDLNKMAWDIIRSQGQEIARMQRFLDTHAAPTVTKGTHHHG